MNIGIVTDFYYPWIGGPATLIRNLGHGLAARGHAVFLLAPSHNGTPGVECDGPLHVTRVRSHSVPFGYNLRSALHPGREVDEWLAAVRPDVLHVHHPFVLSTSALLAARKARIPVVATNHTVPECSLWGIRDHRLLYSISNRAFSAWLKWVLERCDMVTTPTDTASRSLSDLGFPRQVQSISNGVDAERFRPGPGDSALRVRLGLDDRPIVLYTGRLDAEKQMDIWLQAGAEVVKTLDVQFVATGKGTDAARLEKITRSLGLSRHVRFVGIVAENDYPKIYRLANAYFITSPVELQSISTLEAVASGLPVVAVDAGALPELVHHKENGYLFAPGDWRAAALALTTILSDANLSRGMSIASRHISAAHDLVGTIDCYESLLRQAAGRGGCVEQAAFART
ncbi:MAG: glycosyltransferase [Chloroflexota bacterium]|nr:glycosyltransferase [Chloroflexota bacterium]